MKTDELIVRLEEVGYKVSKGYDSVRKVINVRRFIEGQKRTAIVCVISEENMYEASFRWKAYSNLVEKEKEILYNILKAYIETPLIER